MLLPGRHANTSDYRYGFQGQEMDDEIKGEGNSMNFMFRMHDPRVGRFFAIDKLAAQYPFFSPYSFSGNRVIDMVEFEGMEMRPAIADIEQAASQDPDFYEKYPEARDQVIHHYAAGQGMIETFGNTISGIIDMAVHPVQTTTGIWHAITNPKQTMSIMGTQISNWWARLGSDDPEVSGNALGQGTAFGLETLAPFTKIKILKVPDIPVVDKAVDITKVKIDEVADLTEGGAYGRMRNVVDGEGMNLTEKNHLPTKQSYKLAGFKISDYMGSANIMNKLDHRNFITTGSSKAAQAFREAEAMLLNQGRFMEAFDLNAAAIREAYGDIYDKGIKEAREHFAEEVVPKLKEQFNKKN